MKVKVWFLRYIPFMCLAICFTSCSPIYNVYLRNLTNGTAFIDVFLLDKSDMTVLPNKAKVANRIVDFKSGYRKYFDGTQTVNWIDTGHFRLKVMPNTTIDLKSIASGLIYGYAKGSVVISAPEINKADTLSGYRIYGFMNNKFQYKSWFFATPIFHYDIKE